MPLKSAEFLKQVKTGQFTYPYLNELLGDELDELKAIKSVLPLEPDYTFWDERLVGYYCYA
jgi:hypothetical protein